MHMALIVLTAGKTTLLKIIGGKHMVPKDAVQVGVSRSSAVADAAACGAPNCMRQAWRRLCCMPQCIMVCVSAGAGPVSVPRHPADHVRRLVIHRRQLDAGHRLCRHQHTAHGGVARCMAKPSLFSLAKGSMPPAPYLPLLPHGPPRMTLDCKPNS